MLLRFSHTILVCAILGLVGCTSVKTITGPDGSQNQLITCGSIDYCYSKAREVCGGNYKIVNTTTESLGSTDSAVNMLVKCDKQ